TRALVDGCRVGTQSQLVDAAGRLVQLAIASNVRPLSRDSDTSNEEAPVADQRIGTGMPMNADSPPFGRASDTDTLDEPTTLMVTAALAGPYAVGSAGVKATDNVCPPTPRTVPAGGV